MSSSVSDLLAGPDRPVVYGSHGGMEPATMEWLVLERGRQARYFTANPWPRLQPYDEIGTYAAPAGEVWDRLIAAASSIAGEQTGAARSHNAGTEYLHLFVNDRPAKSSWVAQRTPAELEGVVASLRDLIERVREHPVRTLRASLRRTNAGVMLHLENRGSEPFRLHGFGPDGSGVHAEVTSADDERVDRGADDAPLRLAAMPRLDVTSPDEDITVAPGGSIDLELGSFGEAGRIECLVHIRFEQESLRGERYTEDGWIWPEALSLEGT